MSELMEFRGITKAFPGVKALDNVSFGLRAGEVHVIVGENGAGKSTLMKILSGAYTSDEGEIFFEGKPITHNSPKVSEELGIRMIYQELNLVPELSIAANIYLGHEIKKGVFVEKSKQIERSREILSNLGLNVDPNTRVKNLSIGTQQMVEIGKALSTNAKVLVFDEPTSSLTDSEITEMFRIIRLLKSKGVGMFYISHRLEELFEIGDRVTVLRDGKHVLTSDISALSMSQLIESIAGRKIETLYPHTKKTVGQPHLEVEGLSGKAFHDVSIKVHSGEIVGMSGLIGAGRSEVARAVFGVDNYTKGEVRVLGKKIKKNDPRKAQKAGICLLPEDRKNEGLAMSLSIRENIAVSSLSKLNPTGFVKRQKELKEVNSFVNSLRIATSSTEKLVRFLSGGTQQKVVLAKWLLSEAKIFMFDEPTRGIDIGARNSIYELMDSLVEGGAAILMISSDLPEVLGMSDRIYVMSGGEVVGEFERELATQQKVLELAFSKA